MGKPEEKNKYISLSEASNRFNVSLSTLKKKIKEGKRKQGKEISKGKQRKQGKT